MSEMNDYITSCAGDAIRLRAAVRAAIRIAKAKLPPPHITEHYNSMQESIKSMEETVMALSNGMCRLQVEQEWDALYSKLPWYKKIRVPKDWREDWIKSTLSVREEQARKDASDVAVRELTGWPGYDRLSLFK